MIGRTRASGPYRRTDPEPTRLIVNEEGNGESSRGQSHVEKAPNPGRDIACSGAAQASKRLATTQQQEPYRLRERPLEQMDERSHETLWMDHSVEADAGSSSLFTRNDAKHTRAVGAERTDDD